jgi:hypothetical protein
MPISQAKIDANRRNSLRSTGPKTQSGRDKSRFNGLTHGLSAKVAVIPSENPQDYDERMTAVKATLAPRNAVEALIVEQLVQASWVHDRAVRVQTAQLSAQLEDAARKEQEAVIALGKRLFRDSRGPDVLYGCDGFHHVGCRTSYSGIIEDENDPDTIVRSLEATVPGCHWLLDRWRELRALLEPGKCWQSHHKFRGVRLLGKQPLSAVDYREVAEIFVGCWAIDPARPSAYAEVKSELGPEEFRAYLKRVRGHWTDMMNAGDSAEARRILVSIVERAIAQVMVKLVLAQEQAKRDAQRTADSLSFDYTHEGELMRRYELGAHRKFGRSLNDYLKIRRALNKGEFESEPESGPEPSEDQQGLEPDSTHGWNPDQKRIDWMAAELLDRQQLIEEERRSDPLRGSSVQCSVFSVQLNAAQPAAEQLVCFDEGQASYPSGSEFASEGDWSPADPLRGSSVQCSVFSVQLNAAQPAAEQLVCFDEGQASYPSGSEFASEGDCSPADPLCGSSVQCSVFSVQLNAAQPAAEQLVVVEPTISNETSISANEPPTTAHNDRPLPALRELTTNNQQLTTPLNESSISAIYSRRTPCYSLTQPDHSEPPNSGAQDQNRFLQTEATDHLDRPRDAADPAPADVQPDGPDPPRAECQTSSWVMTALQNRDPPR